MTTLYPCPPAADLFRDIASVLGEDAPLAALGEAADRIRRRPRDVATHLTGLLRHDLLGTALRSSWHHNGFAKIVVHESARFRVRLHVWPPAPTRTGVRGESDAHNHRWAFASTVLLGDGLDAEHFVGVPVGGEHYERFLVGPGVEGLRPMGAVRLARRGRAVRPHGDVYLCDTGIVHTVEPRGRGRVATIVVQRTATCATSSVFRRPGDSSDPGSRPIGPGEVRDLLADVVGAL